MKTFLKITLLCLVLSLNHSLSAQVQFGVKGGLNLATIYSSFDFDYPGIDQQQRSPYIGSLLGTWVKVKHSEQFSTQIELLGMFKGSTTKLVSINGSLLHNFQTTRLLYLTMPISEQLAFGNFSIELGLTPGLLLSEQFKGYEPDWASPSSNINIYEKFDLSLLTGVSYTLNKLSFNLRVDHSIIPITDYIFTDENGNPNGDWQPYNQNLQITIQYLIFQVNKL